MNIIEEEKCEDPKGDNIHHPMNNYTIGVRNCNHARADGGVWRKAILRRDKYTCQECGRNSNLEAHHIKPVRCFPWLATDINNGITLCKMCHSKVDGIHQLMFKLRNY